jgi:hypothetical protein
MSESADYTSTSWVSTHDFTKARDTYRSTVVDRSYSKATTTRVAARDLVKTGLRIDVPTLIVVCDVTGSMGEWPSVMFSKLPYLMHELKTYLGENAKLMLAAVGDATCDRYPLQIQEAKSTFDEAKDSLTALVVERGGGGSMHESYELAAAYFLNAVEVARTVKPVLVFIADESPYESFTASQLASLGVPNMQNLTTKEVFEHLREIYDVHLIHKPYGNYGTSSGSTATVREHWMPLLETEHVHPLEQPERVVDLLFGILAGASNKIDSFKKEITDRQKPEQVVTVLTSLSPYFKTLMGMNPPELSAGKSTMHRLPPGTTSKPLL